VFSEEQGPPVSEEMFICFCIKEKIVFTIRIEICAVSIQTKAAILLQFLVFKERTTPENRIFGKTL